MAGEDMSAQPPSPPGSMAGWNLMTLLRKNKDKVKLLVSAIGAYLASQVGLIHDPALNTLVSTVAGVVIYIGAAVVDYWLSDNPA